ncbi:MAG: PGN_0703 family putative restriction endonuclease [Planctomyces sp.]|jgi:hypothetical protein
MNTDSKIRKTAQRTLQKRLGESVLLDSKGYVSRPEQNLLPGVLMEHFESDIREGDGNELQTKFCATHSSTALAINSFAWFRPAERLQYLTMWDQTGATALRFERKCPIFPGRRGAPNLDVWVEYNGRIIAIESKLTEYFKQTKPEFRPVYESLEPPNLSEPSWWRVFQNAQNGTPAYLDVAQLIKHYFGLRKFQLNSDPPCDMTLLYLYWEPTNADTLAACLRHREEISSLKESVSDSQIAFQAMSYSELWHEWEKVPALSTHVQNLKARYEVEVSV